MGGKFNPENLKSFDLNNNNKIGDEKDLELLLSALDKKKDFKKIEYLKEFNYELEESDKNNLLSIMQEKIVSGTLSPKNYKSLVTAMNWIKNPKNIEIHREDIKENELKQKIIEKEKKDREINTFQNKNNFKRIFDKLSVIDNNLSDKINEMFKKISYFNLSDLSINEQNQIVEKFNKTLKYIENILNNSEGKDKNKNLKLISLSILKLNDFLPKELGTSLWKGGKEIANAVLDAGEIVITNVVKSFKEGGKSIENLSKLYEGISKMGTQDWLDLPGKIINGVGEWGEIELNKIKKAFGDKPNFLSGTMKTVVHIKNFITKVIPTIIRIIGPGKFLKILKFPGLILKSIKGLKVVKKGIALSKLARIKAPGIIKNVLSKTENLMPDKLNKIFSSNGIKNYGDKKIILLKIREKISEGIKSGKIEKVTEYKKAYGRLERAINSMQNEINLPQSAA